MNNIPVSLNLSNQGNLKDCKAVKLLQYNYLLIFNFKDNNPILNPLRIKLMKSGELLVEGLEEININDNGVKFYSDKKETHSLDIKLKEVGEKNE
ncbi:hypothetical protein [Alkaliphilus pronyensis]|uniref:hypothetical protein n=1 Tax=Alkaliphilus pronyensis TaxID=1482732 RepID=UPI00125D98C6|nr:hypothetical protein [Alkaliphilus pronyensis]